MANKVKLRRTEFYSLFLKACSINKMSKLGIFDMSETNNPYV